MVMESVIRVLAKSFSPIVRPDGEETTKLIFSLAICSRAGRVIVKLPAASLNAEARASMVRSSVELEGLLSAGALSAAGLLSPSSAAAAAFFVFLTGWSGGLAFARNCENIASIRHP